MGKVTINESQQLYVIAADGGGFSCLGFDVVVRRQSGLARWLGDDTHMPRPENRGTLAGYEAYKAAVVVAETRAKATGTRCDSELTPQLVGLEGKRVEVVDAYGERRRFWVGKSTGWWPIHLEVARRDSSGGGGVTGAPFKSVRVIEKTR